MHSATSLCSTPFGITEFDTLATASGLSRHVRWCSTPFGITEFDTLIVRRMLMPGCSGAQRLSASLNSTRACQQCSGVRLPQRAQRLSASLNSTRCSSGESLSVRQRAQRLSASLNSTPVLAMLPALAVHCGAQRLSASLNSTRRSRQRCMPSVQVVLNAFRHH